MEETNLKFSLSLFRKSLRNRQLPPRGFAMLALLQNRFREKSTCAKSTKPVVEIITNVVIVIILLMIIVNNVITSSKTGIITIPILTNHDLVILILLLIIIIIIRQFVFAA